LKEEPMQIGSLLKRPMVAVVAVSVGAAMVLAGSSGLLASDARVNGSAATAGAGVEPPAAVACRVLDPGGDPVTVVPAMSFGDLAYWLEFRSSGALARTVEFRTVPLFQGSPALGQVQKFNTDDSNVVTTPFGVPDWGVDKTSGPWSLTVRDNLGRSATCPFEVVP
jgi:hypothetical protein